MKEREYKISTELSVHVLHPFLSIINRVENEHMPKHFKWSANTAFLEDQDVSKHVKEKWEKPINSEQKTVCVSLSVL